MLIISAIPWQCCVGYKGHYCFIIISSLLLRMFYLALQQLLWVLTAVFKIFHVTLHHPWACFHFSLSLHHHLHATTLFLVLCRKNPQQCFRIIFWHLQCKMIHTVILKSWYVESVNFTVVLTFPCKIFHMCIPAVVTLVLYELFMPYMQLGKRSVLMWIQVCNISITTETLPLGTTAKSLAQSCLHPPFGYIQEVRSSQSLNYLCGTLLDSPVCPCLSY